MAATFRTAVMRGIGDLGLGRPRRTGPVSADPAQGDPEPTGAESRAMAASGPEVAVEEIIHQITHSVTFLVDHASPSR
jgi:hypothetical protein